MTQKSEVTIECGKIFELQSRIVDLGAINDALSLQLRDVNDLVASIIRRLKSTEVNTEEKKEQNDR
jgi:cell fate (sporulation/competence/biofilm development) regulator YmcA (YheA/YmcA/DUF963 family)